MAKPDLLLYVFFRVLHVVIFLRSWHVALFTLAPETRHDPSQHQVPYIFPERIQLKVALPFAKLLFCDVQSVWM